jgi:hypothetical protein
MNPEIYNAGHLFNENVINFDIPVEIHVNRFLKNEYPQYILKQNSNDKNFLLSQTNYSFNPNIYKVFVDSNEPAVCYMKEKEEDIIKFCNFYNLILTSNKNILDKVSNSKLFLYGTTWLNKQNKDKTYLGEIDLNFQGFNLNKINSISFLKTNKSPEEINIVPGYGLREKIWPLKNNINHNSLFYYSNVFHNITGIDNDGPLPNDNKLNIFNSKFSIIIENSKEVNYFSEKLIDCLLTKTIPIYWGCPNIGDYFDINGFILFNDENDFLNKINSINLADYYISKQSFIENNFSEAKKYAINYSKRLENIIKEYLNV